MLTFSKIPYVFMLFFINFILFYSYVTLLVIKKNITVHEKIYIIIITIAFVYVGIGRGTSFEFFQLLILLIYVLFSRFGRKGNMHIRFKPIIISIILVSIAINIYLTGIGNRGFVLDFYKVYPDVNFNPEGLLSKLFPFISSLLFRFYDYFGFGFFYVSTYVIDIWFSSIENLIAGSLPFG